MDEIAILHDALDRLHNVLDDLAIRGLRSAGPQDLSRLATLCDEFRSAGAGHLAERLSTTLEAIRADDRSSAAALLRSLVATRLFERMLTLDVAAMLLEAKLAATSSVAEGEKEE